MIKYDKFILEEVGTASFTIDALDKIEALLDSQISKEKERLKD